MKIINQPNFLELPDAFLFDTDNTLYSYDQPHKLAMDAVRNKVVKKFSISEEEFNKSFEKSRKEVKLRLGTQGSSHSRLLYVQKMLEMLGLGSQVLLSLDLEQTYWRTFLSNAILFNDVKELLDDIRILGIPASVVTDLTAQIQFRKLVFFGLENSFDYIVTSEEAGYDKPHEAQFNIAIDKMRPNGKNIWMIGDNPINDIKGAKDAIGAITLQKIHPGVEKASGTNQPDAYFENFLDLRMLIKKLKQNDGN